jgi:hypothetical protein
MRMHLTRRQWALLREIGRGPLQWYPLDVDGVAIRRRGLAVYDRGAFCFHYVITPAGRAAITARGLTAGAPKGFAFTRRSLAASIPAPITFHFHAGRRAA